jgi:hypothetical protein
MHLNLITTFGLKVKGSLSQIMLICLEPLACMFMYYWAGLYREEMQGKIKEGTNILMKVALSIGEVTSMEAGQRQIIEGCEQDSEGKEEEQGNVKRVNEEGGHDGDDASR